MLRVHCNKKSESVTFISLTVATLFTLIEFRGGRRERGKFYIYWRSSNFFIYAPIILKIETVCIELHLQHFLFLLFCRFS